MHTSDIEVMWEPTHSARVNEGNSSFRVEEGDGEVLGEFGLGVIQDGEGERHGGLPTLKCQLLVHRKIVGTCSSTGSWGRKEGRKGGEVVRKEGEKGRGRRKDRREREGRRWGEGGQRDEGRKKGELRAHAHTLMVSLHLPVVPLLVLTPTVTLPTVPPARTMVRGLGVPSRAVGEVGLNWKRPAPPSSSMIVTREERLVVERRGEVAVGGR